MNRSNAIGRDAVCRENDRLKHIAWEKETRTIVYRRRSFNDERRVTSLRVRVTEIENRFDDKTSALENSHAKNTQISNSIVVNCRRSQHRVLENNFKILKLFHHILHQFPKTFSFL